MNDQLSFIERPLFSLDEVKLILDRAGHNAEQQAKLDGAQLIASRTIISWVAFAVSDAMYELIEEHEEFCAIG